MGSHVLEMLLGVQQGNPAAELVFFTKCKCSSVQNLSKSHDSYVMRREMTSDPVPVIHTA